MASCRTRFREAACLLFLTLAGCGTLPTSTGPAPQQGGLSARDGTATQAAGAIVTLQAGWNAVGLNGLPVTTLTSTNVAGFAFWDGANYQTRGFGLAELNDEGGSRRGLWVFATAPGSFTYGANDPGEVTSNLRAGWNLLAFPAPQPVAGNSLVVRENGQVVPLTNVLLPQFSEINPNNTYTTVDVSTGGHVNPGKAYWVFAARAVTLTWTGGPAPSPTPGGSPAGQPVSINIGLPHIQNLFDISSEGRYVSAEQLFFPGGQPPPHRIGVHKDLQTNVTTDTQFIEGVPDNTGGGGGPSSADGSRDVVRATATAGGDFLAIYSRASNSSALEHSTANVISGAAISAGGNFISWTERASSVTDVLTKTIGGSAPASVRQRFPALSARNLRTEDYASSQQGQGSLSDDGSQLFVVSTTSADEDVRHLRLDLATGAITEVFVGDTAEYNKKMSGDGRLAVFDTVGANSQTYVRAIGGGAPDDLVSQTPGGQPGNGSSFNMDMASDGRFVLFTSLASNLVPEDTNESMDLFLRDRTQRTTVRVNVFPDGTVADHLAFALMSRNGQWILFKVAFTQTSADPQSFRVRNPAL